jgi:serine/tyrosine/threonine adenylyltransferase
MTAPNPLLSLNYEAAIALLGDDYADPVPAAEFPQHILRWRNDDLLPILGVDPQTVSDADFIEAFGKFAEAPQPFLALRYHGYQFQHYNPALGDGRGFLYGQVRGTDGLLYDFGTKGSGRTPYSRGGDGRLTLKGGVREVIAAEALQRLGVRTSRCLSLVETGEQLWRGDEPSPTRSSVMIRMQRSHIRFGTFERLHYLQRKDLIVILLDHVIEQYYTHLKDDPDRYIRFYEELVQRVAELAAQWMSAGFCHAVLNTDNMAITGESFDYGPFAFIPTYDPGFTAAYFDHSGLYAYANQPGICQQNLQLLQRPLGMVINPAALEAALENFADYFEKHYRQCLLRRLGFAADNAEAATRLLQLTIQFLKESQVDYHGFFAQLATQFDPGWREDANQILPAIAPSGGAIAELWQQWQIAYFNLLLDLPVAAMPQIQQRLQQANPQTVPVRPLIEAVWERITEADDWTPFQELIHQMRA